MQQYLILLRDILDNGVEKADRTGTGTRAVFGRQLRFNLQEGFPLLTTKKIHLKSVIHELLWFLKGDTNIKYLNDNGVTIWDEWADKYGELGPVYGEQWRKRKGDVYSVSWEGIGNYSINYDYIDQIANLIDSTKTNPNSRRLIVDAWNPADEAKVRLPWCHTNFQCIVENGKLHLHFQMRSVDTFLGLPFNIASYALLTHMLAQQTNLEVGELVWTGVDVHLYLNHLEQAELQLSRDPHPLPKLILNKAPSIDEYQFEDFEIVGYAPHPAISAPVSV